MTSERKSGISTDSFSKATTTKMVEPKIWWSNAVFFTLVHVAALVGVYQCPLWATKTQTLVFAFLVWQLADFGITIGYHRLYSHRAFRASFGVRVVLAVLGSVAYQGSIKWWCLRHRLHHRYTDDPIHDPYAATRGIFYSHMGWIFYKPRYEKMDLVDRDDLENDLVVRFQHNYYVPIAVLSGFVMPFMVGKLWNDPTGSFIWGGLVAKLFIWHCTFLVNSLAHLHGLQPYSDENTSRGNLFLALLTGGEGNHNFHHAFPHDFRSGPSNLEWDPSKWIILVLHSLGLVWGLRRARDVDISDSLEHMHAKSLPGGDMRIGDSPEWTGPTWTNQTLASYQAENSTSCLILLDGYVVDVTRYLGEHPGGASLLRSHSISTDKIETADAAFFGGFNNHSSAAKRRMRELRVAKMDTLLR